MIFVLVLRLILIVSLYQQLFLLFRYWIYQFCICKNFFLIVFKIHFVKKFIRLQNLYFFLIYLFLFSLEFLEKFIHSYKQMEVYENSKNHFLNFTVWFLYSLFLVSTTNYHSQHGYKLVSICFTNVINPYWILSNLNFGPIMMVVMEYMIS